MEEKQELNIKEEPRKEWNKYQSKQGEVGYDDEGNRSSENTTHAAHKLGIELFKAAITLLPKDTKIPTTPEEKEPVFEQIGSKDNLRIKTEKGNKEVDWNKESSIISKIRAQHYRKDYTGQERGRFLEEGSGSKQGLWSRIRRRSLPSFTRKNAGGNWEARSKAQPRELHQFLQRAEEL